ncbi:MAG TPA: ABC transporter substrate-binding protein [Pseudolabrys sp.]|nr:ABC transporter substrate-binding protein [Pseudolabrys sp.]
MSIRRAFAALGFAAASLALAPHAFADDTLKLAIGQRGLWDSSIAEAGQQTGIFKKHGLDVQVFYTSSGGETLQVVIGGSSNIGIAAGTLGVLGAFAKGAPLRIIAGEATGTAEYYFVRSDSPIKKLQDATPATTLAYSTNGSGTNITALRFMKDYGFKAKLVATGTVPATFTQVMSGQIDIGFSTPPFGLKEEGEGKIRIIALANDLKSVRTQTVRVIAANANDLAKRPDVYKRFVAAYGEIIDWMYSDDPKAIEMFAKYANISPAMAKTVRDKFYPKTMLQLDRIDGLDEQIQDAIAFKYMAKPLTEAQRAELLQLQGKR